MSEHDKGCRQVTAHYCTCGATMRDYRAARVPELHQQIDRLEGIATRLEMTHKPTLAVSIRLADGSTTQAKVIAYDQGLDGVLSLLVAPAAGYPGN